MPKTERKKLLTPIGRFNFVAVFNKAKAWEDSQSEPGYEVTIVFDVAYLKANPDELARFNAIKASLDADCVAMYKKPVKDCAAAIPRFWNPLQLGEVKEHLEGFGAGKIFFKAKSKRRPGVVGPDRVTPIDDPEAVYSGCWGRLNVTTFAYGMPAKANQKGGKGCSILLNSVMFVRDGERLDGGTSNPAEDFGEAPTVDAPAADSADDLM